MSGQRRQIYEFDNFRLDIAERQLLRDGKPVVIPAKAFDLLHILMENEGRLVEKEELYNRVWANQIVEDSNLTVQMSAIRKALGEQKNKPRYIITVPGFGYRFVGQIANAEKEEIIIETQTISHTVIEEEDFDTFNEDSDNLSTKNNNSTEIIKSEPNLISQNIQSDHLPLEVFSNEKRIFFLRKQYFIILSVGLILTLLIGGLIFWKYELKAKNHNGKIPFTEVSVRQLTKKGNINWAAISPDGKFFVYTLNDKGDFKLSLWLAQVDGSNDIQIRPPENALYRGIAFSHDGKMLYFSLNAKDQSDQGTLFKMPVLGGVPEKILDYVGPFISLSPDDKQVAYFQSDKERSVSALIIADLDGTGKREVLTQPLKNSFSSYAPAWSPDGTMFAVAAIDDTKNEEIFIVDVQKGRINQLTHLDWRDIVNLVWQSDSQGILAVAKEKSAAENQLWQIDYPEGTARRISRDVDSYGLPLSLAAESSYLLATQGRRDSNIWLAPSIDLTKAKQVTFGSIGAIYGWQGLDWSPNGKIFFTGAKDQSRLIYSINADGSGLKQLTAGDFSDQKLNVTSDGRFLVFQSNRSGSSEIWRANIDGSDLIKLTNTGRNTSPDLTPDSKWVVYASNQQNKSSIYRIPVEGGEAVRIIDKDCISPRVSPEGKLIACFCKVDNDGNEWQLALFPIEGNAIPLKMFDLPRSANLNNSLHWTPDGRAVCYRDWVNGIWNQGLNDDKPKKLVGLPEEEILQFAWSPDGKSFAFTRGKTIIDAILISDKK